ncbi:hypothetical protein [Sphingomonas sp. DC1400]|uniref:hypothetical protein n=1 Tax=unclassified Sphingomonas TaxID=196159 RepID=UPI003CEA7014
MEYAIVSDVGSHMQSVSSNRATGERVSVTEKRVSTWAEMKAETKPTDMEVLEQLVIYQSMMRKLVPYLDAFEALVLGQIVDRTIGWKKVAAYFSGDALYAGDEMYGGIARAMDRSRMWAAIKSLERRGIISRGEVAHSRIRIYRINTDMDEELIKRTAKPISKSVAGVRNRRRIVSKNDNMVSSSDYIVAAGDDMVATNTTGEQYNDKDSGETGTRDNRPQPAAPVAGPSIPRKRVRPLIGAAETSSQPPTVEAPSLSSGDASQSSSRRRIRPRKP